MVTKEKKEKKPKKSDKDEKLVSVDQSEGTVQPPPSKPTNTAPSDIAPKVKPGAETEQQSADNTKDSAAPENMHAHETSEIFRSAVTTMDAAQYISRQSTKHDSLAPGESVDSTCESLRSVYFKQSGDDAEVQESQALMAESVLAYDAMSSSERQNEDGRSTITSVTGGTFTIEEVAAEWKMLSDHKMQILDTIRKLFRGERFGKDKTQKVAYSSIKIGGKFETKEVCFVPEGMTVCPSIVSQEVLGKKGWRLAKPNMLLKFDCGSRHPSALSTKELIDLREFKQVRMAAELAVDQQLKVTPGASEDRKHQLVQKQIDQHLQDSLSREILPAMLDAALKTKNWIVVDRSNATASSASAELLIEMSLNSGAKHKPTVFVFDSISRFESFKPSRIVNMQLLELCRALSNSSEVGETRQVTEMQGLYNTSDFESWEPYHMYDSDDDPTLTGSEEAKKKDCGGRPKASKET